MAMHLLPTGEDGHEFSDACPCHPVRMRLVDGPDPDGRDASLHQSTHARVLLTQRHGLAPAQVDELLTQWALWPRGEEGDNGVRPHAA